MSTQLSKGANVPLAGSTGRALTSLLIGLSWPVESADVDVCALLCAQNKKVIDDAHFLFWDQPQSPDGAAFLRWVQAGAQATGPDRAQLLVSLDRLGQDVKRIFVTLSTLVDGGSIRAAGPARVRVVDCEDFQELAVMASTTPYVSENCAVLVEVYLRNGLWKVRAVDQGYDGGLGDLGRDYGVDIA